MEIIYWLLISLFFVVAFIGLVYPIIPSVLFVIGGFIVYGIFFSFDKFSVIFWAIQGMFVLLLFGADYVSNLIGIKKFGGSKAAIWGSTIGLLIGPFVIPIAGIIIGPFAGAVIAESVVHKKDIKEAIKIGGGSLLGFLSGVIAKVLLQLMMISYFLFVVL